MSRKLEVLAHRWGLDRLAFRIWRYNPRGLLRLYRHHAFDRRLGVDTRGYSDLRYEPTPADVFHEMIRKLPFDPREFVFVDLGSGKGKVLMLAAQYPFGRVIGVELWEDFHRIALANLESFRGRSDYAPEITSIRMDAADFVLRDFAGPERAALPNLLSDAADAVEAVVEHGLVAAQQRFHSPA